MRAGALTIADTTASLGGVKAGADVFRDVLHSGTVCAARTQATLPTAKMEVRNAKYQALAGQFCRRMPGMVGPALHACVVAAWGAGADTGEERDGAGMAVPPMLAQSAQRCACADGCAASGLQVVTLAENKVLLDSCMGNNR